MKKPTMNIPKICNRIIEYSFYALFLLTPLMFTSATSELFELNKMWLVWALTIIIGMSWLIKMILQKEFIFKRTPLDIPIALFLISQVISTIFSLDSHTSFWGYYSRFNGGLLSIVSYIILYYAFLSNVISENSEYSGNQKLRQSDNLNVRGSGSPSFPSVLNSNSASVKIVKRLLLISLISGLIVALWGLPSHFGYDPTCLIFRGTLDVSCWTADFMPKVRIFSTLGQPNWLAAYLAILMPIAIAFLLKNSKFEAPNPKQYQNSNSQITKTFLNFGNWNLFRISIFVLLILFYIDLLYTRAQSGFLGIWFALAFFFGVLFWMQKKNLKSCLSPKGEIINPLSLIIALLLLATLVIGTPIARLNGITWDGISKQFQKIQTPKPPQPTPTPASTQPLNSGGTESGKIRLLVWEGAINAWKSNPIFGTGVETFAFAYYKYKPAGQNLTSEWNFLYNKAHNEYLNYLATTGIFGLGTYLLMIGSFLFAGVKALNSKHKARNPKQFQNSNNENSKRFEYLDFKDSNLFRISNFEFRILPLALIASYVSILITNFFGFSVVITNVYLFMIPAFVFVLTSQISNSSQSLIINQKSEIKTTIWQWTPIFFILMAGVLMLLSLFRFWRADIAFALGYNLDRAGEYQQGYPNLRKAVQLRGDEPVFKDELSLNNAIIAAALVAQKPEDSNADEQTISVASTLAQEAINTSNDVVSSYPNNVVFWKTRTRLFFTLSQVDSRYLPRALDAIEKASLLAPNDANIWYNLGVLYGQNNNLDKGISALEKTIMLKPDYRDAHFGLGLFYHQKADSDLQQKAVEQMQYILDNINPKDENALSSLEDWAK